jgi:acetyl-CoA C-acetyltransferase
MVEQASFVSRELGISREEQDRWALRSHERAVEAIDEGRFADEIVPVGRPLGRRGAAAGHVAREARFAAAGLRPRGHDDRRQRAGCERRAGRGRRHERGVREAARARGARDDRLAGLRRRRFRVSRADAGQGGAIALEKAGKTIDDVERVELNEAFSSVVLNSAKMLGADEEKVNVNGGAVALGHPIGASGARILGTMVHELRRNGGGLGSRRSARAAARATRSCSRSEQDLSQCLAPSHGSNGRHSVE